MIAKYRKMKYTEVSDERNSHTEEISNRRNSHTGEIETCAQE